MSTEILDGLKKQEKLFLAAIPQLPQGHYVHFVLVRETESFPLFQTDGTLNVIRVQAGRKRGEPLSRLVMFKRKQSSPERLTGRELLRSFGIIAEEGDRKCEYNSSSFCKKCPDCILYGYTIGDAGAEKSKVYVDSAFSVSAYEESHKAFSFNALSENGTMWEAGASKPRSSFGEQDHVMPQVFFPSIVTLRDPTYEGFLYILGNLLRTDRYGAQDARTGKVHNHLIAVTFANGEIFSNLRYSQAIYDQLQESNQWGEPLQRDAVLKAAVKVYGELIGAEAVSRPYELVGDSVTPFQQEVTTLYQDAERSKGLLQALDATTRAYAQKYGAGRNAG